MPDVRALRSAPEVRTSRIPSLRPADSRIEIPRTQAWGSVFVPPELRGHFLEVNAEGKSVALPSFNRFMNLLDLARTQRLEAVTVYLEVQPKAAVDFTLSNFGILSINVAELTPDQMRQVITKTKECGIHLDLHAPWLSGPEGRGSAQEVKDRFSYPDPRNNPEIFRNISEFSEMYNEINGHKLELTIHTTGKPEDWAPWISQAGKYCRIHVENGFQYIAAEAAYPADGFAYFNASRPYKLFEYMGWIQGLIQEVHDRAIEIDALVDIAHAAAAENDPLAYIRFMDLAIRNNIEIKRVHVASVNLDGKTLSERDNHGPAPEFSRTAATAALEQGQKLGRYDKARYNELARLIQWVFTYIEMQQEKNDFGVTVESKSYFG